MNNQAAQTMPSIATLPFVTVEQVQRYRAESLRVEAHRNELLNQVAALSQTAGVADGLPPCLRDQLQQKCSDWGTYWRAPDAHGVILSQDQAAELLRDALCVEVEVSDWTPGAWSKLETWLGNYADSIPNEAYHELCAIQKLMNPKPQPPAAASVSERARSLLAQAYRDGGYPRAAGTLEAGVIDSLDACALSALEQALTQQRGEVPSGGGVPFGHYWVWKDGTAQFLLGQSNWALESACKSVTPLYTTPQPGAEALPKFAVGDRATWTNKFGTSFPGTIEECWSGPVRYRVALDDGSIAGVAYESELESLLARGG